MIVVANLMKTLLVSSLVMLFGLAVTATSAQAQSKDEAAVRAAHEALVNAAKSGDRAALEKLFAEDLQYSHSNTKLENKKEAIDALISAKIGFEIHSQTIRVYGNTATIRCKATAHTGTGDIPLTMLLVWTKKNRGGAWQLVERHTTRIPAE